MTNRIEERYFNWLVGKVGSPRGYRKLMSFLFETPFVYILPMDGNRYEDGVDLRYRFGNENDIPQAEIAKYLDHTDCSLLEMMAALAIRCEEHIMEDDDYGDRTPLWFREMLNSTGLYAFTDASFNKDAAFSIVDRLFTRTYAADGSGGLFRIKRPTSDMRRAEIWCQAMAYLNEVLTDEKQE